MRWLGPSESSRHPALAQLLSALDDLVRELEISPHLPELRSSSPLIRNEIQLTCYPGGGARYVRHVDNNDGGGSGEGGGEGGGEGCGEGGGEGGGEQSLTRPRRRGRVLTTIYYANPTWCAKDGGELRIYTAGEDKGGLAADEGEVATDVEPLGDRLVCFWSDQRVPHEVRPAHAPRFAVSIWFEEA
jgi:hypoxia-inducible factor (prolyl hydroxylase)